MLLLGVTFSFSNAVASFGKAMEDKNFRMHYVYILKCNDGNYYTGCTSDLKERFVRHQKGYVDSTKLRLPVSIAFYCAFPTQELAYTFEKYLKTGSGIAFRNKHLL